MQEEAGGEFFRFPPNPKLPGGSVQTNESEEDKLYAKLLEHWDK